MPSRVLLGGGKASREPAQRKAGDASVSVWQLLNRGRAGVCPNQFSILAYHLSYTGCLTMENLGRSTELTGWGYVETQQNKTKHSSTFLWVSERWPWHSKP